LTGEEPLRQLVKNPVVYEVTSPVTEGVYSRPKQMISLQQSVPLTQAPLVVPAGRKTQLNSGPGGGRSGEDAFPVLKVKNKKAQMIQQQHGHALSLLTGLDRAGSAGFL
jgi:hypothetical protein